MAIGPFTFRMLEEEARGLQTRLDRVKPFALLEPMVPAANLLPERAIGNRAGPRSRGEGN